MLVDTNIDRRHAGRVDRSFAAGRMLLALVALTTAAMAAVAGVDRHWTTALTLPEHWTDLRQLFELGLTVTASIGPLVALLSAVTWAAARLQIRGAETFPRTEVGFLMATTLAVGGMAHLFRNIVGRAGPEAVMGRVFWAPPFSQWYQPGAFPFSGAAANGLGLSPSWSIGALLAFCYLWRARPTCRTFAVTALVASSFAATALGRQWFSETLGGLLIAWTTTHLAYHFVFKVPFRSLDGAKSATAGCVRSWELVIATLLCLTVGLGLSGVVFCVQFAPTSITGMLVAGLCVIEGLCLVRAAVRLRRKCI